jgi:pimeloyl-ACP methyl ester carboxylesterase
MGSLGHEYWRSTFAAEGYSGHFLPGELEERLGAIGNTRHVEIPEAGHQVHYDQPDQLAKATRDFLYDDYLPERNQLHTQTGVTP